MEFFTMTRKFGRDITIDKFHSGIWTERYYGDGEAQLMVEPSVNMFKTLQPGTFLGLDGSDEVVLLETLEMENGFLKVGGQMLAPFLNHRFIRASDKHEDRYWHLSMPVGELIAYIVQNMCVEGPWLEGDYPTGIADPEQLKIDGLDVWAFDSSGPAVEIAVPYGPVYDAIKEIATTYQIGMKLTLVTGGAPVGLGYALAFRSYRGIDRTSNQTVNPIVQFSPGMNSLTNIKEFQSIVGYKTNVWTFAPSNPGELATTPGTSSRSPINGSTSPFDMRALMVFAEDLTTDMIGGDAQILRDILNNRARDALVNNTMVRIVDGEIVPESQFKYGIHYTLGDVIELQGLSGFLQNARITEYIRTQDAEGERAFPTVSVIE